MQASAVVDHMWITSSHLVQRSTMVRRYVWPSADAGNGPTIGPSENGRTCRLAAWWASLLSFPAASLPLAQPTQFLHKLDPSAEHPSHTICLWPFSLMLWCPDVLGHAPLQKLFAGALLVPGAWGLLLKNHTTAGHKSVQFFTSGAPLQSYHCKRDATVFKTLSLCCNNGREGLARLAFTVPSCKSRMQRKR